MRERLGLGGRDTRLRHGAMRDGLQASGFVEGVPRGLIGEFWDAPVRPSRASQVRPNGFPSGSAAVGACPFSPPTPEGVSACGAESKDEFDKFVEYEMACGHCRRPRKKHVGLQLRSTSLGPRLVELSEKPRWTESSAWKVENGTRNRFLESRKLSWAP